MGRQTYIHLEMFREQKLLQAQTHSVGLNCQRIIISITNYLKIVSICIYILFKIHDRNHGNLNMNTTKRIDQQSPGSKSSKNKNIPRIIIMLNPYTHLRIHCLHPLVLVFCLGVCTVTVENSYHIP